MNHSRKGGFSHHSGYPEQGQGTGEQPMFANDDQHGYTRSGHAQGQTRFGPEANPQWQTQPGQQATQAPDAGAPAAQGLHAQSQTGWEQPGPEEAMHAAPPESAAGSDAGAVEALQAEIEALKAELEAAQKQAAHNQEQFVRASAETENVRRRGKEELDKARKFAIEGFAESLLPVCDSLEMALKVESPSVESIREGAEATLRQLLQALERNKVQVVDPVGQRFDPNTQQAISMQPTPGVAANHVAAVLQKGYLINDRVLRPAMVVVSQG
jgi:grpE